MVKLTILDKRYAKQGKEARKIAAKLLILLKKENFWLDLYIISRTRSRKLNKELKGIDREASVLSFSTVKDWPDEQNGLGEIYLAPATFKKKGYSLQLLIVHGVLHLLGFSHEGEREAEKMEREEERLLKLI